MLLTAIILVLSCCKSAFKKKLPTAKDIVERYIEVSGGREKIKAVKSLREEGVVAIPGKSYAETIYLYEPGKTCLIYKASSGYVSKTVYNNGRAADIINGETTLITDSLRLERMKLYAGLFADAAYYLENNYQLIFVNTEKIDGRPNYRIKVTSPLGATDYELYDAETGLLTMQASADGYKTTFSDYETQEGLTLSMVQKMIRQDGSLLNIQATKLIFNKPIDPKLFEFK